MAEKLNYKKVQEILLNKGFILLDEEYKNCKTPLLCLDKDGYKVLITMDRLMNRNISGSRFHSFNPYSIENLNHFAKINSLQSICISKVYKNHKTKLLFKCNCGRTFMTTSSNYLSKNKTTCDVCSGHCLRQNNYFDIKNQLEQIGYYIDISEKDFKGISKTLFICHDKDGYKYILNYDNITTGSKPYFVSKDNKYSIDNINLFLKKIIKVFNAYLNNILVKIVYWNLYV